MAKKKGKGRGWWGESARHSAVAKAKRRKGPARRGGSKRTKTPKKKFKVAPPFDPTKFISAERKKKFLFSSQFNI